MTPSLPLWLVSSVLALRQICSPAPIVTSLTEVAVELVMMLEWSAKVVRSLYMWQRAIYIPYSWKLSLGANFRDFCRQTCFHENKTTKKCTRTRPFERDGSLQSVCSLNGCCKESACYYTKYQWIHKRRYEVVKVEISSAESNMPVLTCSGSFATFVILKASTQKEN